MNSIATQPQPSNSIAVSPGVRALTRQQARDLIAEHLPHAGLGDRALVALVQAAYAAGATAARGTDPLSADCRARTCTYYQHYLAYGPAELEHEGYHAAERECARWQRAASDFLDAHPDALTSPYDAICLTWEGRVRA